MLAERIFRWVCTRPAPGPPPADGSARGHRDGRRIRTVEDLTAIPGAGDVWSTVADPARYGAALGAGELLGEASRRALSDRHAAVRGEASVTGRWVTSEAYGYGVALGDVAGHRAVLHGGDNPGHLSFHAWLPGLDACLVLLSNDEATDVSAVVDSPVAVLLPCLGADSSS